MVSRHSFVSVDDIHCALQAKVKLKDQGIWPHDSNPISSLSISANTFLAISLGASGEVFEERCFKKTHNFGTAAGANSGQTSSKTPHPWAVPERVSWRVRRDGTSANANLTFVTNCVIVWTVSPKRIFYAIVASFWRMWRSRGLGDYHGRLCCFADSPHSKHGSQAELWWTVFDRPLNGRDRGRRSQWGRAVWQRARSCVCWVARLRKLHGTKIWIRGFQIRLWACC